MIDWVDVAGSIFENLVITVFIIGLNLERCKSRKRIAAFLIPTIAIISLINSSNIPYHAFITVGLAALSAFLILKIDLICAVTDAITGFVWVLLFELFCSLIMMLMQMIVPIPEITGRFVSMTIMVIVACMLVTNQTVQRFLSKHYYPNRKVILWIWITILIASALVINLWSPDKTMYSNRRAELLILVGIYVVLNGAFIYSLLKGRKTEQELFETRDYEEYLQEVMKEMNSHEHEYKNHLQHIISLTESDEASERELRIGEYAGNLIEDEKNSMTGHMFSDDLTVSIMLLQFRKRAEEQGIELECFVDKPFPDYNIPEKELIELVSNAVNNAFEAVIALAPEKRSVFISFQAGQIEVINTIEHVSDLQYGISTKGEGRGYGRMNMKAIADRNHIKLNTLIEEDRYIVRMKF